MAKKKPADNLTVQAKDTAEYVLVQRSFLERLRVRNAVDGDWTELAQRIAARLGRADAWMEVLSELTGEAPLSADAVDPSAASTGKPTTRAEPSSPPAPQKAEP